MTDENTSNPRTRLEPAKIIVCMLPDDGTDIKVMRQLRKEKNVTRAASIPCRGVHNLQLVKLRLGKLPEPTLYRFLSVIVTEEEADDVYDFICNEAKIGQPDRGVLVQTTLIGATRYLLPDDVPEE